MKINLFTLRKEEKKIMSPLLLLNIQIFINSMAKTRCVGGRHNGNTNNKTVYEKMNPKNKKLVKIIKGIFSICGRNNSQIFTKLVTRGENSIKNIDRVCQILHGVM